MEEKIEKITLENQEKTPAIKITRIVETIVTHEEIKNKITSLENANESIQKQAEDNGKEIEKLKGYL